MQEPVMRKAITTREFLSQDERARQLYEERQKAWMTYTAEIEGAREEGREQGEHRRALANARKLAAMGMDVKQIAEVVDLPLDEVQAIRRG